jgi:hypothetical protein
MVIVSINSSDKGCHITLKKDSVSYVVEKSFEGELFTDCTVKVLSCLFVAYLKLFLVSQRGVFKNLLRFLKDFRYR